MTCGEKNRYKSNKQRKKIQATPKGGSKIHPLMDFRNTHGLIISFVNNHS